MDLPAHGASKLTGAGPAEAGRSVRDVCETEAPVDAIIAHSFGFIATAAALRSGASADYVILIAPPVLGWEARQNRNGTDPTVFDRVLKILADDGRALPEAFGFESAFAGFDGKLRFIGSDDDDVYPGKGRWLLKALRHHPIGTD
jgi:alpha-beta hydrolase superfamily lysophospholipase